MTTLAPALAARAATTGADSPALDAIARDDRLPVAQVETEGDAVPADVGADFFQRFERRQGLEPDDQTRGPPIERVTRAAGGRDAGVQPEWRAERGDGGDLRVLRRAPLDRVEVGDVQLGQTGAGHIRPRQRHGVAIDRRPGGGSHRLVALAPPGPCVHGASGEQVDNADYPQDGQHLVIGSW